MPEEGYSPAVIVVFTPPRGLQGHAKQTRIAVFVAALLLPSLAQAHCKVYESVTWHCNYTGGGVNYAEVCDSEEPAHCHYTGTSCVQEPPWFVRCDTPEEEQTLRRNHPEKIRTDSWWRQEVPPTIPNPPDLGGGHFGSPR